MPPKLPNTPEVVVDNTQSPESPQDSADVQNQNKEVPPTKLDTAEFLNSFENDIDPKTIIHSERRVDGVEVMYCNNLFEYLRFGFQSNPEEVKRIEKHEEIFRNYSSPETVDKAAELLSKLSSEESEWIMSKLEADGSIAEVKFNDGNKRHVVMMNRMPTKRKFNKDQSERTPEQISAYESSFKRTVEHEVRHVHFFNKYGKDMKQWKETMEKIKPLSAAQLRKYHYDRFTKDEIAAHIENEVLEVDSEQGKRVVVNWNGIVENLQKSDYMNASKENRKEKIFKTELDVAEYKIVVMQLVNVARDEYDRTGSIDKVTEALHGFDVTGLLQKGKKEEQMAA